MRVGDLVEFCGMACVIKRYCPGCGDNLMTLEDETGQVLQAPAEFVTEKSHVSSLEAAERA
jgi:hypothetical protein